MPSQPDPDARAAGALARLAELAGARKTIDTSALVGLAIRVAEHQAPPSAYHSTGETVRLAPDTELLVAQGRVRADTVRGYVRQLAAGIPAPPPLVTDRGGALRHLDGLHRLLAARMLGETVVAELWR
jgi:hypothetical protein